MASLPAAFLEQLEGVEELMVSSREGSIEGSVLMWFKVAPQGRIFLFTSAFSLKARRWRADPWVRLRIPGTATAVEGTVHAVAAEAVETVAPLVIERWADWGATHVEGLRRMLLAGTHTLLRVEASDRPAPGVEARGRPEGRG
jgi:hypothetical protein